MKLYKVIIEPQAQEDLNSIFDFIEQNGSKNLAKRFVNKLYKKIKELNYMPYRCRKSIYINEESVRDLIVQGYTIVYKVQEKSVHILTVFRQKETL